MARRRRRPLIALFIVFVVLPAALVISMRLMRTGYKPPVAVRGQIFRLRNFFTEIYGARAGGKVVLFDAGIDTEGHALDALLAELHATRDDVSDVFLTHGHFDHVAASPLCSKARIHVGAPDVDLLAKRDPNVPFAGRWFGRILPVGPITATDPYVGRVELPVDGGKVIAIPLPGHTSGSYVLYYDRVLFAGDSMQIEGGKLDFCMPSFSLDPAANKKHIANLKAQLGDLPVDVVCTGHQGCITVDGQKLLDELIARATAG